MTGEQLIMELTWEQGQGRETQVQPPLDVWVEYFGIDLDAPPQLTLTNASGSTNVRPVVRHDHNWTVEVPEALGGPPRIIRFRRTGPDQYEYTVHGPGDEDFERLQWLLEQFPNPHRKKGRLWLIV